MSPSADFWIIDSKETYSASWKWVNMVINVYEYVNMCMYVLYHVIQNNFKYNNKHCANFYPFSWWWLFNKPFQLNRWVISLMTTQPYYGPLSVANLREYRAEWRMEIGVASDLKFNLKCISLFTVIISTHLWIPVPQFNLQNTHSIALKRPATRFVRLFRPRSRRMRTSQDQFQFQF